MNDLRVVAPLDEHGCCVTCAFDVARWAGSDAERTVAHGDDLLLGAIEGLARPIDGAVRTELERTRAALGQHGTSDALAAHQVMHAMATIAGLRAAIEPLFTTLHGTVDSVHASDGGVPKTPIDVAVIDVGGVVGDRQASRVHHGRPWQALCLYSRDVIDDLQAEGHPIVPGAAGENITISGVEWTAMRSGLVVRIGSLVARLSAPSTPCTKNNRWFVGTTSERISHERHPGASRWYASVLAGGTVRSGDVVEVGAA